MTNVRFYGRVPYQAAVLHGGPGALGDVAAIARELGKDYGVIEPLQTKNSIAGLLIELDEVLSANCDQPIILIGHSWGAWLAWLYAARYPDQVSKLILVGSGPFESRYAGQIGQRRLSRLTETEQAEYTLLLEGLDSGRVDNKDELLSRLGALVAKTDNYCPVELQDDPIDNLSADGVMYNAVWNEAVRLRESGGLLEAAAQITCPVVVIHGDSDPHPLDGVKLPLAKLVKNFTVYLLEKCGHSPWKEKYARERFYEIVRAEFASFVGEKM
jgi:pimeloyl-ACP methyl ester carboxylesterase